MALGAARLNRRLKYKLYKKKCFFDIFVCDKSWYCYIGLPSGTSKVVLKQLRNSLNYLSDKR